MASSSRSAAPDAAALAPLLTPQGWQLLSSLPPYDPDSALRLGEELRKAGHSPQLVSAALTQQRLRERATAKFGPFASQMLFTPDGLEQATRLAVSAHHAARYAKAGVSRVADLGCGIGGDAVALAGLDLPVLAVERDEATAALATVNLMAFSHAEVLCADALEVDLAAHGVDAIFADPARRAGGRRLTDPEQWSPRLSQVLALRDQVEALGIKVAPGIEHATLPADSHVQWVSVGGEVVEAGIWCGPLAPEGPGRSALVLTEDPHRPGGPTAHVLADPGCVDPRPLPSRPMPWPELRTWLPCCTSPTAQPSVRGWLPSSPSSWGRGPWLHASPTSRARLPLPSICVPSCVAGVSGRSCPCTSRPSRRGCAQRRSGDWRSTAAALRSPPTPCAPHCVPRVPTARPGY